MASPSVPARVLLVVPHGGTRQALVRRLEDNGVGVLVADAPRQASDLGLAAPELGAILGDGQLLLAEGQEALGVLKRHHPHLKVGAIHLNEDQVAKARRHGVDATFPEGVEVEGLVEQLAKWAREARRAAERSRLLSQVRRRVVTMVDQLANALEARDPYTAGHSLRVARLSLLIADELGLSAHQRAVLEHGAALHDIGKIAVRREVLHKPGRLTDEEYEHIKIHPVVGREILEPVADFQELLDLVYLHHERIDGQGYPEGRRGSDIPLLAQIVAVADTFDAMTSDRPYRKGMPTDQALAILEAVAGTQLNPDLVGILTTKVRSGEADEVMAL